MPEVLHEQPDRRKRKWKVQGMVSRPQFDLCSRFLQIRYHSEGEYLPDRFDFEGLGRPTLVYGPETSEVADADDFLDDDDDEEVLAGCQMSTEDWDESDSRALAGMAIRSVVTSNPFHNAMTGPQLGPGPRRYLGVVKPIVLYQMCRDWCEKCNHLQIPSWSTFLRALRSSSKFIAFRKAAGQHGLCDQCQHFKKELRRHLSIADRTWCMEEYASHLLRNWRDRQVDSAWHSQAGQTRQAMLAGSPLSALHHSVLLVRSDGLDQAKHKVPRVSTFSKAFTELVRPAMHVQMLWAHFHSFEFAISDPDLKKDSATHMDALSRFFSAIFDQHQCLPKHLIVILDNTSRDNKNSFMIRYFIKCKLLGIWESVYLAFPEKGHTHGPLDAVGGQAVTKCSNCTFHMAHQLVDVYQEFLDSANFEPGTFRKKVWKHDVAADWREWAEEVPLTFGCLTGPQAPHGFRILFRKQLEGVGDVQNTCWPDAPPPHPDDLVMAVHRYMSDEKPFQIALLVPARQVDALRRSVSVQPSGSHGRRHISLADREEMIRKTRTCFEKGGINEEARMFLTSWAQGTLRREPRPHEYSFLKHRFDQELNTVPRNRNPLHHDCPRRVVVLQRDGQQPIA